MADHIIKIPRATDRAIAVWRTKLSAKFNLNRTRVNTLGFGSINIPSEEGEAPWQRLLDHDSFLIASMSLSIGGLAITYQRGGAPDQNKGRSPIYDEITFSWHDNQQQNPNPFPSDEERLEIVAITNNALNSFDPGRTVQGGISDEQSQLLAIHQSTLERLEHLNEDLIRRGTEFRSELDKKFQAKVEQVEKDLNRAKADILTEKRGHEEKIAERERALEEKLKAIDNSNNTHARRAIRDKMLADVTARIDKFGVSKTTEQKRRPVFWGIVIMLVTFCIIIGVTFEEITNIDLTIKNAVSRMDDFRSLLERNDQSVKDLIIDIIGSLKSFTGSLNMRMYILSARLTFSIIGLLGTILYYIKWQNRWAEQHISSEFQLQQFHLDVNRANWVIEAALEWKTATQAEIPSELTNSITRGLFYNNQTEPERVVHPADALASALVGSASKLKLRVGDNELLFDKPGKITNKPKKVVKTEEASDA